MKGHRFIWKLSLRRRFLLLGLAAALAPALMMMGMLSYSAQIDDQARLREQQIVTHGIDARIAETAHLVVGQAVWDDAAKHLNQDDLEWARFNVGDFFTQTSQLEYAAVVNAGDSIIYAVHEGHEKGSDLDRLSAPVAGLVHDLRSREPGANAVTARIEAGQAFESPVQATNLVRTPEGVFSLTATLVQPDKTASLYRDHGAIIVVGEKIDAGFLAGLGDRFLLENIRVADGKPVPQGEASVVLSNSSGQNLLTVAWTPERPGSRMLWRAAPLRLLVLFVIAVAVFLFQRRASRALEQLVASERRASHLAYHDALTGLPNRALVAERLAEAISRARRSGHGFAVHCLDLDRFKDVNDTFGHQIGDELICRVSEMLVHSCRGVDLVGRLGGDEFAIIQENCTPRQAADLAERVCALLSEPVMLSVGRVYFGGSLGISMQSPGDMRESAECLREADLALYKAKSAGRGRYAFFEADMDAALQTRRALQNDLRDAFERGELRMVYQPQVDHRDRVTGVEALMRWTHPERGAVSPAVFIPLAEECGLIERLGWFALRRAFEDSVRWPDIKVGVNVSAAQLRVKTFVEQLSALAKEMRIDPSRFELEITEGLLLADTPETLNVLQQIRGLGFQIALDDFGTGYSSLSYLKRFPITRIKIDKSFISSLETDAAAGDVVAAIVRLARALRLAVVAEGVETDEQRVRLASAGCKDIQGYLASRPLDVVAVQSFIDRGIAGSQAA